MKPLLDAVHSSVNRANHLPAPLASVLGGELAGTPRLTGRGGHGTLPGTPCRPPLGVDASALIDGRMTDPRTKKVPCVPGGGHAGVRRGRGARQSPGSHTSRDCCWRAGVWGPLLQEDRSQTAGAAGRGPREQRGGWGLRLGPEGSVSHPLPTPALRVLTLSEGHLLCRGLMPQSRRPAARGAWTGRAAVPENSVGEKRRPHVPERASGSRWSRSWGSRARESPGRLGRGALPVPSSLTDFCRAYCVRQGRDRADTPPPSWSFQCSREGPRQTEEWVRLP